jgi:hypothetical protein
MPVRTWAAATAAAALLAAHTATAAATDNVETEPPPTPTPTPVPGLPELPDVAGSVIYVVTVTTTITTTTTTAPITVVAAPITTTVNNTDNTTHNSTSTSTQAAPGEERPEETRRGRMEINLRGCRRRGAAGARFARMQTQMRLPRGTQLVVRVNGRQVGVLDLGTGHDAKAKPIPLRIMVARDGTLSIWRPSGRVLATQGCNAR